MKHLERDVFSQFGEDGIVASLVSELKTAKVSLTKTFVEFGAHNGILGSNSRNLLLNHGFSGVYIEANKSRFRELKKNTRGFPVVNINEFVTSTGNNCLESILRRNNALIEDLDLLIIDIDGNDYWIFESLNKCFPKIICVEFNPTIPIGVEFIQPKDSNVNFSSSASALLRLASSKGYSLVHMTSGNMFFIRRDLRSFLSNIVPSSESLEEIWTTAPKPTFVFSAIDGTVLLSNPFLLHWHRIVVNQKDIQKLPRVFRKSTGDYAIMIRFLFEIRYKLRRHFGRRLRKYI
jgi:hypothetical protein